MEKKQTLDEMREALVDHILNDASEETATKAAQAYVKGLSKKQTEVYLVKFFFGDEPDIWIDLDKAKRAAAESICDLMGDVDDQAFEGEYGVGPDEASPDQLIEWWNNNNDDQVCISKHMVLGSK